MSEINSKLYGRLNFMNKEELHRIIEERQPNICQIIAAKNNKIVYNDTWNNYKTTDYMIINK